MNQKIQKHLYISYLNLKKNVYMRKFTLFFTQTIKYIIELIFEKVNYNYIQK